MSDIEKVDKDKDSFLQELEKMRPDYTYIENIPSDSEISSIDRPERLRVKMFTAIPMNCKGRDCFMANTCPFVEQGIAPVGKPCPIESNLIAQFSADYIEEFGVNPKDLNEVSLIRDLVDQEIQYIRKSKILANENFIEENVVGVNADGKPIFRKELHAAVDFEDRLLKRKKDIRNQFLQTREAKSKVGQIPLNNSQAVSNIFSQLNETVRLQEDLIKRKLNEIPTDSYIDAHIVEDEESK